MGIYSSLQETIQFSLLQEEVEEKPEIHAGIVVATHFRGTYFSQPVCGDDSIGKVICAELGMEYNSQFKEPNFSRLGTYMKCGSKSNPSPKRLSECIISFNGPAISPRCDKYQGLKCKPCFNNFCLDLDTQKCKIREGGLFADGKNRCTKCKLGPEIIFNMDKGYACVCEEGHYWSGKNRTCIKCPQNTYKNTEVSDPPTCRHCPVGSTSEAGSRACKCSVGSFFNNGKCELCPINTFNSKNSSVCEECPSGLTSGPGSEICFPEPERKTEMMNNDPLGCGKHEAEDGDGCRECPLGFLGVGDQCLLNVYPIVTAFGITLVFICLLIFGAILVSKNCPDIV